MNNIWQLDTPFVSERIASLVGNELHSDFTFIILEDDVHIPAHKIIISAASAVLERIAYGSDQFQSNAVAEVDEISSDGFREILRYIYTDKLNLTEDNIIDIVKKANYYGLSHLELKCKNYLRSILNATTVCWIYHQIFDFIYCNDLIKECILKIQANPIDFFRSEEFVMCSLDEIKEILKFDELKCTEFRIFQYIIKWAKVNCENAGIEGTPNNWKRILDGADQLIRFTTMKMSHFDECVSAAPGFWSIDEIEDIRSCIRNGTPRQRCRFYQFKDSKWISLNRHMINLPSNTVSVGIQNSEGEAFVGKQNENGISVACLINYSDVLVMDSFETLEEYSNAERKNLQVLCGTGYEWVPYNADEGLPLGVVTTGTIEETPILIGRAFVEDDWHLGPIYCRNNQISMTFNLEYDSNGDPILQASTNEFHILVAEYIPEPVIGDQVPRDAVFIGNNENNMPVYMGMTYKRQHKMPVLIVPQIDVAFVTPMQEGLSPINITKENYSFLQMHPATISWKQVLFEADTMPTNAVVAGISQRGEKLYYGRGTHRNNIVSGTIVPSHRCLYCVHNNQVIVKSLYEILVKTAIE